MAVASAEPYANHLPCSRQKTTPVPHHCSVGRDAKYCVEDVCMSVSLSVCLCISKTMRPNCTKFSVRVARGSLLLGRQCNVMLFHFYGWGHFSHIGLYGMWQCLCERCVGASSHRFQHIHQVAPHRLTLLAVTTCGCCHYLVACSVQ